MNSNQLNRNQFTLRRLFAVTTIAAIILAVLRRPLAEFLSTGEFSHAFLAPTYDLWWLFGADWAWPWTTDINQIVRPDSYMFFVNMAGVCFSIAIHIGLLVLLIVVCGHVWKWGSGIAGGAGTATSRDEFDGEDDEEGDEEEFDEDDDEGNEGDDLIAEPEPDPSPEPPAAVLYPRPSPHDQPLPRQPAPRPAALACAHPRRWGPAVPVLRAVVGR